ncbi:hypothetical protein K491DRAFT_710142 [Lophiostoma macrostomum CBS 122681]|uniref:Uncharacterized protein n=1 Tax=Lophiostoma macrostomum CBS 122681 TaxID=1314788 RepID=A0A6A6TQV2_9PLEO|nr:hypothetical protein K491DRAFT_710142 [Lophiostoma macrostomum CBS 122681]
MLPGALYGAEAVVGSVFYSFMTLSVAICNRYEDGSNTGILHELASKMPLTVSRCRHEERDTGVQP